MKGGVCVVKVPSDHAWGFQWSSHTDTAFTLISFICIWLWEYLRKERFCFSSRILSGSSRQPASQLSFVLQFKAIYFSINKQTRCRYSFWTVFLYIFLCNLFLFYLIFILFSSYYRRIYIYFWGDTIRISVCISPRNAIFLAEWSWSLWVCMRCCNVQCMVYLMVRVSAEGLLLICENKRKQQHQPRTEQNIRRARKSSI